MRGSTEANWKERAVEDVAERLGMPVISTRLLNDRVDEELTREAQRLEREVTILAFLQNQWFRNPERVRSNYARGPEEPLPKWHDRCARLNARYLFASCLTGRRLRDAFGEDLCDQIIWENVSPRIGSKASDCFDVDQHHVNEIMSHFSPDVVIRFGKVAQKAIVGASVIIDAPHPAARHPEVIAELIGVVHELEHLLEREAAA